METEMQLSADQWRDVQRRLQALNLYTGQIDGDRGPLTDNAIIEFKKSIGFRARPFFGTQTYGELMKTPSVESSMPWMDTARSVLGLHESRDKSELVRWFGSFVPSWVNPVEISWCGAFIATCLLKWRPDLEVPQNILGARQWGNFGEKCSPQVGAVLTFWRVKPEAWQGHVAFMTGQDKDYFHVLGGNQSNAVTITKIAKSRLLQSRWPKDHPQPMRTGWGTLNTTISTNEA